MWTWVFDAEVGDPYLAEEAATGWDTRDQAESWLRDVYADLAEEGVATVTLMQDTTLVYSMGLADSTLS